ncbi:MAG: cold-shock protein [Kiloniellaceae bacterium]
MTNHRESDQAEITHREITAVVKWFNPTKGFGFVQPSDGSPDAFMHISVVEQSGHRHLPEGATIVCDLCAGQKGPQVAAVHRIESVPEAPPLDDADTIVVEGSVKFYNREKGFGFVTPDDGGKDVFISARILLRAGLQRLDPAQRVRMVTHMGPKGPMADTIEVI